MKGFIGLEHINVTCSFDVLYCDKNWNMKRGFLFQRDGVQQVLVDVEVFSEGSVILLEPYTDDDTRALLIGFGLLEGFFK